MIKQQIKLEVKAGERVYELACSPDSPLGELYDAISAMKSYVVQRINEQLEEEKPKEKVEVTE